jgi:hypothetical protein
MNTTVTSLLGLLGIAADPIRSREHILISNILTQAWSAGNDLDVARLIQQIQSPPITRVGVIDLDSFFPAKERFELAMALNNLLAAPAFSNWMEGESLDINRILYSASGKPRVSIFSIAHLSDAERMFFVSLLLTEMLGWMRTQPGTTSLRAILYMDEIFGYFPPVANPPSKLPLLTLLKQGRAFGLGTVLVTQNPVDLDYKGLSNAGTWFIGRLQTERDKARVLEGLEGIAAGTGQKFDRQLMEQTLAGLSSRIFLLNNVHEDEAVVFETRWTMSYLRGPLTRSQIKTLMDPLRSTPQAGPSRPAASALSSAVVTAPSQQQRPVLPPQIPQYFIPVRNSATSDATLIYHPMLFGAAEVRYSNTKSSGVTQALTLLSTITDGPVPIDWGQGLALDLPATDLEQTPESNARFADAPAAAGQPKNMEMWKKDFSSWIYRNHRLELLESPSLDVVSNPGESERDFRIRLQQFAREQRDDGMEQLRQKYAAKIATLEEKKRRALQAVEREAEQAKTQKLETAISFGATLLSSLMGRKTFSSSTLGRATSTARGIGRTMKESEDVQRAQDTVEAVTQQLADLDAQFKAEAANLEKFIDPQA